MSNKILNNEHQPCQTTTACHQDGKLANMAIDIEVAYALPNLQKIIAIQVPIGTTVFDAIRLSGICNFFKDVDLLKEQNIRSARIGIFGRKIDPNAYVLQDKDRIEIYRPLTKTPNQKRLERTHTK